MSGISWYLNAFLTSWRAAVGRKFPSRAQTSDGTIGDTRHQAESYSEHNPDSDGSVDAWDMDVNVFGSSDQTGNADELRAVEALKDEFQRLPESQLWIHNRQIANRDIDNWKRRPYAGASPHDHHVHWQSRASMERVAVSSTVLDDVVVDAINRPERLVAHTESTIPAWPVGASVVFDVRDVRHYYGAVARAQRRLHERGWRISIDGYYGSQTDHVVRRFQREKGLNVDGMLGPKTWRALWATPVT